MSSSVKQQRSKKNSVKLIIPQLISDEELDKLKGQFLSDEYISLKIDYDCDLYNEREELILSFRKKVIKKNDEGFNYKKFASASRGRGASAGPIDPNNNYWKKRELVKTDNYRTSYLVEGKDGIKRQSKMLVNNQVFSNPIGYFDSSRIPGKQLPCRLTYYTKEHFSQYEAGLPYIQEVAHNYKIITPDKYYPQLERANKKIDFKIPKTPFSTVTVNRNFRTALHKDKGDFGGVACLTVLEEGKYQGGLFMIPKYGIGVDVRQGDILIANVHEYHQNSELYTTPEDDEYNIKNGKTIKENIAVGTAGIEYKFTRLSFVYYLREKMIDCD